MWNRVYKFKDDAWVEIMSHGMEPLSLLFMPNEELGIGGIKLCLSERALSRMTNEEVLHLVDWFRKNSEEIGTVNYTVEDPLMSDDEDVEVAINSQFCTNEQREHILNRINGVAQNPLKPKRKDGYVYLIRSTSGHYKIGISKNPKSRMKQLAATTGPYELELVRQLKTKKPEVYEAHLHEMFADYRVAGEWFDFGYNEDAFNYLIEEFNALEKIS